MSKRPLVALADPFWLGHRETYFREFVLALDRVGADIIALCPDPGSLSSLPLNGGAAESGLTTALLTEPWRLPLLNRLPQDPITTHLRWRKLTRALRRTEACIGRRADFLFLPWLDSYLRASVYPRILLAPIHTRWAGLYFRPHHLSRDQQPARKSNRLSAFFQEAAKGDGLLRDDSCVAVATLDETLRPVLAETSRKPVITFPDITDEAPPSGDAPFAKQILRKARGRKVIGLIGMEPRKGVITMLRSADRARSLGLPWLFVLAGVSCLPLYEAADRRFIEDHIARSREDAESNLLFPEEFGQIPDGPVFNKIMDTFDVLFLAYHDFLGSSNVLTKAAILQKPVVATDLGCIAHRTKQYELGLTIPQGDATACCDAIERLLKGVGWDNRPLNPSFAEYRSLHSRKSLDASMRALIKLIPSDSRFSQAEN